jgi:hypothetical protein
VGAGRFDEVTRLAEEAVAIAAGKMAGRKS